MSSSTTSENNPGINIEVFETKEGIVTRDKETNKQLIYRFKSPNDDPRNMVTCGDSNYISSSDEESDSDDINEIDLKNININMENPEPYESNENISQNCVFKEILSIIKSVHIDGASLQCKEQRMIEMDIGNLMLDMLIKNNIIKVVTDGKYLLYNFNLKNNSFYLELMPDIMRDFNKKIDETTAHVDKKCLDIIAGSNGKIVPYSNDTPQGFIEVMCVSMDLIGKYDYNGIFIVKEMESNMNSIMFENKYLEQLDLTSIKANAELMLSNVNDKREEYKNNVNTINSSLNEKLKIKNSSDDVIEKFMEEYKINNNLN